MQAHHGIRLWSTPFHFGAANRLPELPRLGMRNDIYTLTSEASQAATVFLNVIYAVSNGESGKTKSVNHAPDEQTKTLVALALDPNQLGEDLMQTF